MRTKAMRHIIFFIFLFHIGCCGVSYGQYLLSAHTVYDDSFAEWDILIEQDTAVVEVGRLEIIWGMNNDFSEWRYQIGDEEGEIIQKYENNSRLWELRSSKRQVMMRQRWKDDPSEWVISQGDTKFTFKTTRPRTFSEWSVVEPSMGELLLYTEYRGDARDWIIEDYMKDDLPFELRMAAVFIGIFTSSLQY